MLGVFISGLLHIPMGWMADFMNKRMLVAAGGFLVAAATLGLTLAGGYWGLFAASVVFGLGGGIAMPALMALAVTAGNEKHAMGSVMALITVAHSLGMLLGSFCGGIIMDAAQLRYAFAVGAGIMAAGGVVFLVGTRKHGQEAL
jgi:MFS family permease